MAAKKKAAPKKPAPNDVSDDVDKLRAEVSSLESDVDELRDDVDRLRGDNDDLEEALKKLTLRFDALIEQQRRRGM